MADVPRALLATPLVAGLEPALRDAFLDAALRRQLERGQFLFHEGDRAESLHVLASGSVKLVRFTPQGREMLVHMVRPGQTFGEAAREFVALLRDHIAKEDGVLYVMANRLLDSQDQAELARAFEQVDATGIGAQGRDIAARLGTRFQVTVGTRHQFSCGHA